MSESHSFTGNSRFQVISHLGTGGMGVVYEALDRERDVVVALKTLRIQSANQLLRFKREFRAVRDIRHRNLVELGELFEDGGLWFFTMELVDGVNIRQYACPPPESEDYDEVELVVASVADDELDGGTTEISATALPQQRADDDPPGDLAVGTGPLRAAELAALVPGGGRPLSAPPGTAHSFDEPRLRRALRGLATGLAALHRAGKVHCDIKPSNVMVTTDERVVILDFSVIAEMSTGSFVRPDVVVGSPAYMAPEQAAGNPVEPPADWYAVGVLLFEIMTGRLPFRGANPAELVASKMRRAPPRPDDLVAGLPEDLSELCVRLLTANPAERPNESEVLAALGVDLGAATSIGGDIHTGRTPMFVGRERELELLGAAFRDSRADHPVVVIVEGESGVGKSALVERFIGQLHDEPSALILRGQCHERELVPYNAFDGVVDDLGRFLRARYRDGELPLALDGVTELLEVFPILRSVSGLAERATDERRPGDPRSEAFAALRRLLTWLAEDSALVVVIHDIHWADADSLMLLGELMGEGSEVPLLFLATARHADDGSSCHAVQVVRGDLRRVTLGGLTHDEAEELAHRLFEVVGRGYIGDIGSVVA
ncbi:MAG: serine/threonine-protein kinase, partial [Myxococcota bacterium]